MFFLKDRVHFCGFLSFLTSGCYFYKVLIPVLIFWHNGFKVTVTAAAYFTGTVIVNSKDGMGMAPDAVNGRIVGNSPYTHIDRVRYVPRHGMQDEKAGGINSRLCDKHGLGFFTSGFQVSELVAACFTAAVKGAAGKRIRPANLAVVAFLVYKDSIACVRLLVKEPLRHKEPNGPGRDAPSGKVGEHPAVGPRCRDRDAERDSGRFGRPRWCFAPAGFCAGQGKYGFLEGISQV